MIVNCHITATLKGADVCDLAYIDTDIHLWTKLLRWRFQPTIENPTFGTSTKSGDFHYDFELWREIPEEESALDTRENWIMGWDQEIDAMLCGTRDLAKRLGCTFEYQTKTSGE